MQCCLLQAGRQAGIIGEHQNTERHHASHACFAGFLLADPSCPGLAPEVLLHTFRVFTNDQVGVGTISRESSTLGSRLQLRRGWQTPWSGLLQVTWERAAGVQHAVLAQPGWQGIHRAPFARMECCLSCPAMYTLQVSYTSWFLDAFNYAMATKMNIVNLSIGASMHACMHPHCIAMQEAGQRAEPGCWWPGS